MKHRVVFEKYARVHGFDPLVPKAWYSQSHEKMMAAKVCFLLSILLVIFLLFFYII